MTARVRNFIAKAATKANRFGSARDVVGFTAGLLSICAWLVAQAPQIVSNFRTGSADALSAWFLAEWLMVGPFENSCPDVILMCPHRVHIEHPLEQQNAEP